VYNLTAVHSPQQMINKHILDSLAVLPHLGGARIVDVGSGAGLPGIPLALACPERDFVLLDSSRKRTRFLQQVISELTLHNTDVYCQRAQDYHPGVPFDSVLSRAFASLADMIRYAGHLCAADGRLLAMKGVFPQAELAQMPGGYRVLDVHVLQVPGLEAERHLVEIVSC